MIIKCINKIHPEYSIQTEFSGLIIGEKYLVTSIIYQDNLISFLIDHHGYPFFYPSIIFEIEDPEIPEGWIFNNNPGHNRIEIIMGYKEICNGQEYFEDLINLEQYAIEVYFKRKKEIYPSKS